MRNQDTITKYHDVLESLLHGDIKEIDLNDPLIHQDLRTIREVLCWVLEHPKGNKLQENFDRLTKAIEKLGYKLTFLQ